MTHFGIECPNCGKHSVVQEHSASTKYICLGCGFKGDSSPPPPKKEEPKFGKFLLLGSIAFLVASVLSQLRPEPTPYQPTNFTPNSASNQQIVR